MESKEKANARAKAHYEANKEQKKEYQRQWRKENREKHRSYCRKWQEDNKEAATARLALWYQNNPGMRAFYGAKRRATLLKATPKWLSEEQTRQIQVEYDLSNWCSTIMGTEYNVDHIVPLQGKTVCGLHVPWNLQVIPAKENMKKGNRFG